MASDTRTNNCSFNCLREFDLSDQPKTRVGKFYSLRALEETGAGRISRLPVSIRVVLESLLRNCDGKRVRKQDVLALASWQPNGVRTAEVPFVVARILLQDFTGVPLLADLAAMRSAVVRQGKAPDLVEPLVPVDLVIDHSGQVDYFASADAYEKNLANEFESNRARYEFLRWGTQAFEKLRIVPPGIGICHQVNLEFLARGVVEADGLFYPDSLVGTDSHTTMINGLGVVGWGVGGIEAEAGMLGQPISFLTPDVVGVEIFGELVEGVTATDLVLHVTELLRKAKVVGKFVEFFGQGAATLSVPDRAMLANMAPEYGATMGYFPPDEKCCSYLENTGRSPEKIAAFRNYFKAQGMFGIPRRGDCDYSSIIELNLSQVRAGVAGPKRPQDRINLENLKKQFGELLARSSEAGGYSKPGGHSRPRRIVLNNNQGKSNLADGSQGDNVNSADIRRQGARDCTELKDGDIAIAAITSCTNTSNPSVMIAAGLVAKRAVERGLLVSAAVKTSLAPGSRAVTDYLEKAGLQKYLDILGFNLVGYACSSCIGNSGPLSPVVEKAILENDLVVASVLSGNRNFEARVHQSVRANFLMSPPLVVAFALAGRVDIDLTSEPLGKDPNGKEVFLRDIWPKREEIEALLVHANNSELFKKRYANVYEQNPLWSSIPIGGGKAYEWKKESSYVREPPYFEQFSMAPKTAPTLRDARILAILGDSVTTDHISPASSIKLTSPAGKYLKDLGVEAGDFNSYGSRRGNHEVMVRGTFANVRIRNLMLPGTEGGLTLHYPDKLQLSIYDAAMKYRAEKTPLVVFAGQEYGTGSSRDWAAKGPALLGVRAIIAQSFERIHRSNLVGMGILPCQFTDGVSASTLFGGSGLDGSELISIEGLDSGIEPHKKLTLVAQKSSGESIRLPITLRIDTPIEVEYFENGGILPYVLRKLLS